MFSFSCTKERQKEVPWSMAIGKGELMHEYFPKTLAHLNGKNEIRHWDRRRWKEEWREYGKKVQRARKKEVSTAYLCLIKIQY